MDRLADLFYSLGNLLFAPLLRYPLISLTLISLAAGVVLLLLYGKVSRQESLRAVKRDIYGSLLEAVIFRNNLRSSLAAQADLFKHGIRYFLLAVPPLLVLAVPCILLLSQLNYFFGTQPARVGEPILVTVQAAESEDPFSLDLHVADDGGAQLELSEPVRVPGERTAYYRLIPRSEGLATLVLQNSEGGTFVGPLAIGQRDIGFGVGYYGDWLMRMLYISPTSVPAGIESISLSLPAASYSLLGVQTHWLLFFFLLSLVSGLLASKLFRIVI